MKLVLLPGLDGTGQLFRPLLEELPFDIRTQVITYPLDATLGYKELLGYVLEQLPNEDFILLGESFSGPIAYQVALLKPRYLKSVIFVASFLENPRPFLLSRLLVWTGYLPIKIALSFPMPKVLIKYFLLGKDADESLILSFLEVLKLVPAELISSRLEEIRKLNFEEKQGLDQVLDIGAVYLQASNDKLVANKKFTAYFNNLDIHHIEGPHFLLQAKPEACAEIIRSLVFTKEQMSDCSDIEGSI